LSPDKPISARTYDKSELLKLKQTKAWDELLGHLEDIGPLERDKEWEKLTEEASIQSVLKLEAHKGTASAVALLEVLEKRFSFLSSSSGLKLVYPDSKNATEYPNSNEKRTATTRSIALR